jgi:hypothetical protein
VSLRVRQMLVEGSGSVGQRARDQRWQMFRRSFPDIEQMVVLDLGGTVESWIRSPIRPQRVHLVNTDETATELPSWITTEIGDACALSDDTLGTPFDVAFSNSVIEHVGGHARRVQFAAMVEAVAPFHWIQTPYRYFPVEPHWVAPFMQYLPLYARAKLGMRWPLAYTRKMSFEKAVASQLSTELLDITQMHHYFPRSTVQFERIFGLVKSIIAVRRPQ